MKKQSLYSEKLENGNRNSYFDIRETERGTNFLKINQVSKKENEDNQRQSIAIFESEIDLFASALVRTLLYFNLKEDSNEKKNVPSEARTASIQKAKTPYPRAYEAWTKIEDAKLALLFSEGKTKTQIGEALQRNPGAINIRIEKLNLVKAVAA